MNLDFIYGLLPVSNIQVTYDHFRSAVRGDS